MVPPGSLWMCLVATDNYEGKKYRPSSLPTPSPTPSGVWGPAHPSLELLQIEPPFQAWGVSE